MSKTKILVLVASLITIALTGKALFAQEAVLFDFENGTCGWQIPDWALEKDDYVAKAVGVSQDSSSEGKSSLKVDVNFPGDKWSAAYVEIARYFDWSVYDRVSVDVYLPASAPAGLKAKMILTIGESWVWVEMAGSVPLEPGKWTTITANLMPMSTDFRASVDEAFRKDVRKVGIRIEANKKPAYTGPVYIDNFRVNKP